MIIVYDTLNVLGGTNTLMVRMGEWCVKNNIKFSIFCTKKGNEETERKLNSLGIEIFETGSFNVGLLKEKMNEVITQYDDVRVINFNWNHYLDMEIVKSRTCKAFSNIMYVVHPDCMKKGVNISNKTFAKMYKKTHLKILNAMNADNAIVFMDEENLNVTENFYNTKINLNTEIIRLPIEVPEISSFEDIIKRGFEGNIIMTASRAEFPYKGYIIGLIHSFIKLKDVHKKTKLFIISDGEDIRRLKAEIENVSEPYRKDILLIGWVEYEKMLELMRDCKVYVGMGTTVMEAAKNYKLVIAAQHDTESLKTKGYFYQYPHILLAPEGSEVEGIKILDQACSMDFEEYRQKCLLTYEAVKKLYGIENVMPKFLHLKGGIHSTMNRAQMALYSMYRKRQSGFS